MLRLGPAALALFLLLPACTTADDPPGDVPADTTTLIRTDDCPGVPGTVTAASVEGDTLTYTVQYGGCDATETWACWQGDVLESSPPQLLIDVHHGDAGDCEALQSTTRTIELSVLRDRFGDDVDPMTLVVDDVRVTWQP